MSKEELKRVLLTYRKSIYLRICDIISDMIDDQYRYEDDASERVILTLETLIEKICDDGGFDYEGN